MTNKENKQEKKSKKGIDKSIPYTTRQRLSKEAKE